MIPVLHLFGMRPAVRIDRAAGRIVRVLGQRGAGAVFRNPDGASRMRQMGAIEQRSEIGGLAVIPAEIPVVAQRVGDVGDDVALRPAGLLAAIR